MGKVDYSGQSKFTERLKHNRVIAHNFKEDVKKIDMLNDKAEQDSKDTLESLDGIKERQRWINKGTDDE